MNYLDAVYYAKGIGRRKEEPKPEEEKETSLLDDAIELGKLGLTQGMMFPNFLGGLATETAGNILQGLGDLQRNSLAGQYAPEVADLLQSLGEGATGVAETMANTGTLVPRISYNPDPTEDTPSKFINQTNSAYTGALGNVARFLHADKVADAYGNKANELRVKDEERPAPDFTLDYLFSGLPVDFGELTGSMAAIAPAMAALPESAVAGMLNPIAREMINRGMYGAAKVFSQLAPNAVRYGLTSAPLEGIMEGGMTRENLLAQGYSDEEATKQSAITAAKNMALLLPMNTLEGLAVLSPLARAGKLATAGQIGGRGLLNTAQESYEEFAQEGIQNAAEGKPYSYNPFNGAENQYEAAKHVAGPAALMGLIGGGVGAYRGRNTTDEQRENQQNWNRGSQENISNDDYAKRANLTSKQAEIWDAAQYASARAKEKYGYDIQPELIYKQWAHEAGVNFDSENARYNNNFGGLTQTEPNGEENKQPDGDNYYRHFNNVREYADAYVDDFIKYYPEISGAKNEREFANVLKKYGYFGDSVENYASSMEGIAAPSSRTDFAKNYESIHYLGDNGKGEGNTWQKQNDNVSLDRAQPDLLNAIDVLGKWFYDRTGKRLVVTAGTNGTHADGEHSHAAGWKVDVNDWDGESDGYLVTADGSKGSLTDEFIKFGQSIGLGMNWEGDHIDVALDGNQWADENGNALDTLQNFGGFNPRKTAKNQSSIQPSQQQQQPTTPKPIFDITREDEQAQDIFAQFAEEKYLNGLEKNNNDEVDFFSGMFDTDGKFQSTKENRDAIRQNYADEFTAFAQNTMPQEQTTAQPKQAQSQQIQQAQPENPLLVNDNLRDVMINYLDSIDRNTPENSGFALEIEKAFNDGKQEKVKSMLESRGVSTTSQADPVTQNKPPENILPTPQQQQTQSQAKLQSQTQKGKRSEEKQQKLIADASAPVNTGKTPKGNNNRIKQAKAIITLANENKVQIPKEDKADLYEGNLAVLQKWHDELSKRGLFNASQPQVQAQQVEPQRQDNSAAILKAREAYDNRKNKAMAVARNLMNMSETDESFVKHKSPNQSRTQSEPWEDLSEWSREHDITGTAYEKELQQRQAEEERHRQWKAKQDRELEELKARQAENKRLAEVRRKMDEEKVAQQAAEEKQQQIENVQSTLGSQDTELQRQITFALSEPSTNKQNRERQGNALLDLLERPQIKYAISDNGIVNSLKPSLKVGGKPAILKAQEILNELEAPEQRENRPVGKIRQTKSPIQLEQERRQREQKKQQRQWELAQRREDEELQQEIEQEEEDSRRQKTIEQDEFEDELQFESEMQETKMSHSEGLEDLFDNQEKSAPQVQEQPLTQEEIDKRLSQLGQISQEEADEYLNDITKQIQPQSEKIKKPSEIQSTKTQNTVLFKRNGTDSTEIQEGRKAIKNAPDGTKIHGKWVGFGENSESQYIIQNGRLQRLDENGYRDGKAVKLSPENIRKHFGQSSVVELELTYPENKSSTEESQPANQTEPKKMAKSKWRTIGSADSREDLQSFIREKFSGAPLTIQDDGSVVHEETGEILSGIVRNNKGRWQYGKYEDNTDNKTQDIEGNKAENGNAVVNEKIPQELQPRDEQLQEQSTSVQETPSNKKIVGDEVDATTDSGKSYKVQYKVIEAKDLTASHVIDNGNVFANENYPKELQPRDRNRSGMKSRLIAMAQNLNPAQLLEKALNVNLGAPTIRNDGVILNGNGRTAAIQHAYKNNHGESYKKALIERAKEFGLNSEDIAKMNQPVLVREMISGLTEQETRDVTNAQAGGEKLSASEQATADADKISESTLAMFPKGESIDFTNRDNAEFVNALLRDIATPSEMNNLVSDEGLTQDGVNRITRALFAYAYGNNQKAIRRVTESTDDNVKAITNSLITAVPYLSKIKGMIEKGELPKYKFEVFADALEKLSALRAQGETLYDFLNQTTLFEEDTISDDLREALQTFETFKRSQKKLTQTIKSIARQIYDQRDSHKENLFGEKSEAIPLTKLIREARDEVANEGQKSLFPQQGKDVDTTDTKINKAAKNPDTAKALEQLGAKIENGKVTTPDVGTKEAVTKHIENERVFAWHGTPHNFDEFSLEYMSSGEGNQAHGWGLYFTSDKKVAENYKQNLAKLSATIDGVTYLFSDNEEQVINASTQENVYETEPELGSFSSHNFIPAKAILFTALQQARRKSDVKAAEKFINDGINELKERNTNKKVVNEWEKAKILLGKSKINSQSHLYKTKIPSPAEMIDEDKTLSEQPPQVRKAVEKIVSEHGITIPDEKLFSKDDPFTGRYIYQLIGALSSEKGSQILKERIKGKNRRFNTGNSADDFMLEVAQLFIDGVRDPKVYNAEAASKKLNEAGVKGVTYVGESDGRCYVVFDDKAIKIIEKYSKQGKNVDTTIRNYVDQKDLTPQQQLLQDFGRKLGTRVIFFNNGDGRFHGQHSNGITYLNVVSNMPLGKVFWHESMHWLKSNNSKLYQQLVKAAEITDEQRQAYLERTERNDLKSDEAIDEEIIADQFEDVAKRSGLLQSIAGKNRGLIQRVIQWLQDTMKKFIEHFRNPQGKLTTAQSQALADEFGKIAKDLVDPNGEQIFRYNRRTHNVELANGRDWDSIEQGKFDSVSTISFSTTGNLIATDEEYMQAVEEFQSAKTESYKQQALEALQSMVQKAAEVSGFHNAVPEQTVAYKVRTTAAPKKAIKVYKVFTVASDGSPTALFVGGTEKLPQGVWLDAQDAYHFKAKNGLYYVPSTQNPFTKGGKTGGSVEIPNESIREELIKRGFLPKGSKATKITALAYRPGWHAGTLPFFPQGGMKPPKGMKSAYENIHRYNQVVFECELAAEKNYTAEAEAQLKARNKDGSLNSRKADLQYMPENGFYYYATNPMTHGHPEMGMWAISGSLKINRALTQEECDKILADNGKLPQEWEQGKLNLADLGYTGEQNDAARKTLAPITYDDNGNIIPLSQRFDATKNDIRYSIDASDNSNESTLQRIRNKVSAFFNPPSKSRNKRIKQFLEKLADIRIVAGHIKGAKLINVDEFHRLLHTRKAYDWENILPEIGGMLAKSLNIQDSDAMRNYVTDWLLTGAPNNNSAEAMIFQQAARNNPAMFEILQKIRDEFDEFNNLEPEERYAEGITDGDKTLGEKLGYYKDNWREEFTDDLHPIERMFNQVVEKAEKTNPKLAEWLKESVNPYELARLVRGKGAVANILIGKVGSSPSKKINEIRATLAEAYPNVNFSNFKPITMILEEIGALKDKKRQRLFEAFCVAKLDKEMYEKMRSEPEKYKDITPFQSESDADATIAKYEKEFGQAQRDLVHYSNILLTMRYDAGLMSKSKYNDILSGWKNYIPTARVFEENEDYDFIDSLKQKTGSHRDIRTPIQKLIDNTNSLVKQAERNKVKCQVAQLARCGQFGQIIAVTENSKPNLDNTVLFYEHGKKCWLETPDLSVVRALNSIQSQKDGAWIVKAFNAAMSFFRSMLTNRNLDFAAGNTFRDSAAAYIHNKHLGYANPFMFFADVARIGFKGFWTKDSNWLEWQTFGGSQASFVSQDVDYVQRSISDITETGWESFKKHPLSYILDKMQYVAEMSETATRLTTYVKARDALAKQRADGKATIDDKRRAALTSRNATIDFSRAGTSTRKANRVFAFANAAVQDWALQAQTFSPAQIQKAINGNKQAQQQIVSAAVRLILMGVIPTALQFVLMHSDDEKEKQYKNLHDWEKETYWYLPIPGFEIPFRIPKSMDIGVRLSSAIIDELLKTAVDKDPAEWKRFKRLILDAAPGLTATLATPAVEAWANYSFFRDAPIVPGKEQHLPGNLQYGHDTSSAAKFISDNTLTIAKIFGAETGFSPRKIDYMISGYLGFMGRFFSGGTDEYPIARRFIYEPYKNPKIVKDYYEAFNEQSNLYNGYKLELQRGKKVKPPEDFDPKLYGRLKSAQKTMQNLSKREKQIEEDPKLSESQRKEKLRELELRRVEICERVFNKAR